MSEQDESKKQVAADASERRLVAWVEAETGGTVTRLTKFARWRGAWDIDVDLNGEILPLHARAERELNFAIPIRIVDEIPMHELLESNGLPVPHVFGLCPDPYAVVMSRLGGSVDLTFAPDDAARDKLIDDYLALLGPIYAIPLDQVREYGIDCPEDPTDSREVALGALGRWEAIYDELVPRPDPVAVFLRRWLHLNVPSDRVVARFVTFDAFQFMFDGDTITGLLDFELAHVGDPMMDLAALRVRDTIKHLGDLASIADRFERATGLEVDHDAIDFYTVLYNALTVLSAGPAVMNPWTTTDHVSHQAWYVNSARWAFETISEIDGYLLDTVEEPTLSPGRHHATFRHLAAGLRPLDGATVDDNYHLRSLGWVARHLIRVDEVGDQLRADDVADISKLVGRSLSDAEADAELVSFIEDAEPASDEAIVKVLDAIVQRQQLLLAPPGSLMLRHPRLRSLRPGQGPAVLGNDEGWPAGSISGTG